MLSVSYTHLDVYKRQVEICDHVVIGAGAVVTKNITENGVYAGNPAKKIRIKYD